MQTVDDILARIRAFASERGWRPSRLAREAGLGLNTLRDMHKPDWSPTADTVRKLEALMADDTRPAA